MLNIIPQIYDDELVYSWISRTYSRSGYLNHIYFAKQVFSVPSVRPDFEYINPYKSDFLKILTKDKSLLEIINKHTMFTWYARFMPPERRKEALNFLLNFECNNFYKKMYMPKSKDKEPRYLRFCPLCVKYDRAQYGEAYYHRSHQIKELKVCPKHKCYLIDTGLQISSCQSPILSPLEEEVKNLDFIISNNELECKIAEYVNQVFQAKLNINLNSNVGHFLHSRLGTQYLSPRGEVRQMRELMNDYLNYYSTIDLSGYNERWVLDKMFYSEKINPYGICLLGMFLDISPTELVEMKIKKSTLKKDFDSEIFDLHSKGYNYREIANTMGASYDVVKSIGSGRYGKYHYRKENPKKGGAKRKDWDTIDNEFFPKVVSLVNQLSNPFSEDRPIKITIGSVERLIGLKEQQLKNLQRCSEYVNQHYISN